MTKYRRSLGVLTALATAAALALPLAGVALASHGAEPVAVVDLEPEQDSASTGTCNAYTIDARDDDTDVAEGEVIDVIASQEFREAATAAPNLQFCVPTTVQPAPGGQGGQAAAGATTRVEDINCPTDEAPNEDCVIIHGQFTTDANGRVIFGIVSNQEGGVQVSAFAENQDPDCAPGTVNNQPDAAAGACAEPQDTATKTFTAGGQAGANALDCEPESATNNLAAGDTTHTFTCTATNAAGDPVAGVEVDFTITAGPNAENDATPGNQGPFGGTCTTTSGTGGNAGQGTVGQATCSYNENIDGEAGETGTDTIVAFVDQDADNTADGGEPQDEIQKRWTRAPRTIDCEPETATNNPGDESHVVTCTVTDAEGAPVGDVQVTFTENGPGRFDGNERPVTDNDGRVTIITTAQQNEEGTQEITGTITDEDASTGGTQGGANAGGECTQAADQPTQGNPAGVCADQVLKNWTEPDQPPPPPEREECRDNIDNDGDGLIDFPNDPNCSSPHDDSEATGGGGVRECANVGAILGTGGNDLLVGTEGDDIICGFEGDDTIRGLAGNDILLGQAGDDILEGGDGQDTLRGASGNDVLEAGDGKDVLRGGRGADTLKGNKGHDTLRGGRGHDTLRGGRGNDTLRGGRGSDSCRDRFGFNVFRSCER